MMANLHEIEKEAGDCAIVRKLYEWTYHNANHIYSYQNLAVHKEHMKANRTPKLYTCHRGPIAKFATLVMPWFATDVLPLFSSIMASKEVFKHKHASK